MSNAQIAIIKCLLERQGGTIVTFGKAVYHFKDDGLGNHIAPVADMKHIQQFIGIPEAYELFGFDAAPAVTTDTAIGVADPAAAGIAPVASVQEDKKDPAQAAEKLQTTVNSQAGIPDDIGIDELRAIFLAEVGREPSPKAKAETMIAQINTIRAERSSQ